MLIRYYGHAGQLTGYGRAAEGMCHALLRAGAQLEIRTLAPYDTLKFEGANLPLASHLKADGDLDPNPDVVIVHTLPMDCRRAFELAEPTMANRPVWVAYTTWEALEAPDAVVFPFGVFDQIWHPSGASASSFEATMERMFTCRGRFPSGATVRVMPHCFDESRLPWYRERVPLVDHVPIPTGDDVYRFYSIGAWTARKNPLGLLRAYIHTFSKADRVELVLVCQGLTPMVLTQAILSSGLDHKSEGLPIVRCEARTFTDDEIWRLHRAADCFVSASRGEAWNLPAFEAVLAGRHVIAPGCQGSDEFLSASTALRVGSYPMPAMVDVRIEQRPVSGGTERQIQVVGAQGLTSKSLWQEPDLRMLGQYMRMSYEKRLREGKVHYDLAEKFGYQAVGEQAAWALRELVDRR